MPANDTAARSPPRPPTPENTDRDDNTRKNRNICNTCGTLFKMTNGERICSCVAGQLDLDLVYDGADNSLRIEQDDQLMGTVSYIRGTRGHPAGNRPDIQAIVRAAFRAGTTLSPATSSDSEEDTGYQVIQSEEEGEVTERERRSDTEEEEDTQLAHGAVDRAHGAEGENEETEKESESEEEKRNRGRQRRKEVKQRRNTSTGYDRLDGMQEGEHDARPPEVPDQDHLQGEANPRADDPEPEDEVEGQQETSPMHTRSGRTWGPQDHNW